MSVIKIEKFCKSFGNKKVLDGVDFSLEEKQSYVIVGGSGTGKSVFIKCILGLLKPDRGSISILNQPILTDRDWQSAMTQIAVLFQGSALFDSLPIWENIAFGLIYGQKICRQKAKGIAMEKLDAVKLDKAVADLFPAELSGGMQRRVALARAIACKPKIIFFDEPTTGLDPIVSSAINSLISDCVKELGASAITITHDMNCLKHVADKISLLKNGRFDWTGTIQDFKEATHPDIKAFRENSVLS